MSCVSTRLDATHALITRSLVLQALEWRAAAQLMFHLDTEQSPSRRPFLFGEPVRFGEFSTDP